MAKEDAPNPMCKCGKRKAAHLSDGLRGLICPDLRGVFEPLWMKGKRAMDEIKAAPQPVEATVPDQTLVTNMRKSLMVMCDVVDGWQKKCAELESEVARLRPVAPVEASREIPDLQVVAQRLYDYFMEGKKPGYPYDVISGMQELRAALAQTGGKQ